MINYEILRAEVAQHPYPLLFATISGAHLYGFPSPDSDFDLRGVHVLPVSEAIGMLPRRETVEVSVMRSKMEIDLVTHDALKFFSLMLKRNGYVLEQLYSPLVVSSQPEHEELTAIGLKCITRHHSHHYLGFAKTQWGLFAKEDPPRIKPLLYVYRVLLTGIYLMKTGEIEANLPRLNEEFRIGFIDDLIAMKTRSAEQATLDSASLDFHADQYHRLVAQLEQAAAKSNLRDEPAARQELNDLLVRVRLRSGS
jgi:predicted nucleotidyltransferase